MIDGFSPCSDLERCLEELIHNDRLAVVVSKSHAENSPNISDQQIFCFTENNQISNYPVVMMIHNDNPFKKRIEEIVEMIRQSGLMRRWTKDHQKRVRKSNQETGPTQFTMQHIFPAIVGYSLFMIFSFLAFIGECLVYWQLKRNPGSVFWRFSEMFIDGRRYVLRNWPRNWAMN